MISRQFFIGAVVALLTFISLQAIIGNRFRGPFGAYGWNRGYNNNNYYHDDCGGGNGSNFYRRNNRYNQQGRQGFPPSDLPRDSAWAQP